MLGSIVATPAFAQAGDSLFTGPRVELHGGWDHIQGKLRATDGETTVTDKTHKSDGFFGGQIGYDYAIGGANVIGAFASYDLSNLERCGDIDADTVGCFKAHRNIEAGVRAGRVFGGKTLVYVKGAYVNGRFGASLKDVTGTILDSTADKRDGWRAGLGVEEALTPHVYVKAEYNYSQYSRFRGDLGTDAFSVRPKRQEALLGLGLRL